MDRFDIRLNKEDYNKMVKMEHRDQYKYLEENVLSMSIVCGYGFYGHSNLREENGEYLVNICTGSSCD